MTKSPTLKPLEDVAVISGRKLQPFSGERPYYATGDVGPDGELADPTLVTFTNRPSRAGCLPQAGDVGFARMRGTRKTLLVDDAIEGALFSTGFCFLEPRPTLDPRFLYYCVTSDSFFNAKEELAGEGIMGGITNGDVAHLRIPVPSLEDQRRIVEALDEVHEGLSVAIADASRNEDNARALFESRLHALINRSGAGRFDKTLGQIAIEFGRGKSKHRPRGDAKLFGGEFPFIQTGDVSNADHWLTRHSQTYNAVGLAQSKLWPKGTICIAIVGANVAETGILTFDSCFPDSVIGLVVDNHVADTEYVEYLLQSFKAFLKEKGKGTARDNINLATFEAQLFPFPPLLEQRKLVTELNALADATRGLRKNYEQKQALLASLKQSILHDALFSPNSSRL